jgi:hypothetical protein
VGRSTGVGPSNSTGPQFKLMLNISNSFKYNSNSLNLIRFEQFEIKYGCKGFDERNNFPYWNVSKFGIYFELKIRKGSRC